jgi:integrase
MFLDRHAALRSARTYDAYRRVLERDVIPRWGKRNAPDVHRAHVMDLLDEIAHDRGAPIAANRTRAILHALFNFALARDLVPSNPVAGVPRPAPESRRDRVLSSSEIRTLWGALDGEAEPLRSLVRFLLLTGQRSGETCRLRWADVDRDAATWSIPGADRKGGRAHRVPLSPQAVALLDGLRPVTGDSEYTFASPSARAGGGPFRWLSHAAGRLREAAGFAFRIHDLRRTCASGLAELGTDRDTISKVLGHKSADAGVIAIYDRYDREPEKRAALLKWGARLEAIVEGGTEREELERVG